MHEPELTQTREVIEAGIEKGSHTGAQLYLSLNRETIFDGGIGEASPGRAMEADTVTLWMSSGKPVSAVAIAQLVERGKLRLDDRVVDHIPEFGAGNKEGITIEHLLTHTGGFRGADLLLKRQDWPEAVRIVYESRREPRWTPGRKAGYHIGSSWYILGELVRRIDGRPIEQYIREDLFGRLGRDDAWMGIPVDRQNDRIGEMHYTAERASENPSPYNSPEGIARIRPGGNLRGPASALGTFYEDLLSPESSRLLKAETIRQFTGRVRVDLFDETFKHVMDWGLGFMPDNKRHGPAPYGFGAHCSERTFGHGGAQSSAAFADPDVGLAAVIMFNGMPGELRHQRRIRKTCEAIYEDLKL